MAKKQADIPRELLKPTELVGVPAHAEVKDDSAYREMIEKTTQFILTFRFNPQWRDLMNQIIDDLSILRFKPVDVIRHTLIHYSTMPADQLLGIVMNVYYDEEYPKKNATTFGINRFTRELMEESISRVQAHAKKQNIRLKLDASELIYQSIPHFARLPRQEKLDAIQEVKTKYADMLVYLTPAQAEAALASL